MNADTASTTFVSLNSGNEGVNTHIKPIREERANDRAENPKRSHSQSVLSPYFSSKLYVSQQTVPHFSDSRVAILFYGYVRTIS